MTSTALTDPNADLQAELDRLAARQLAGRGLLMRGVEAVGRLTEGAAARSSCTSSFPRASPPARWRNGTPSATRSARPSAATSRTVG